MESETSFAEIATDEARRRRWLSTKGRAILYSVDDIMLHNPDIVEKIVSEYYLCDFIDECRRHYENGDSDLERIDGVGSVRADDISQLVVQHVEHGRFEWTVDFYESRPDFDGFKYIRAHI
jgi:hypothetical protein